MKEIKFAENFKKLPICWEGTQCMLLGVYPTNVKELKNKYTQFLKHDTQIRTFGGKHEYYKLDGYSDVVILIFMHYNTGTVFTTIRRNTEEKFEFYMNSIGETFRMVMPND